MDWFVLTVFVLPLCSIGCRGNLVAKYTFENPHNLFEESSGHGYDAVVYSTYRGHEPSSRDDVSNSIMLKGDQLKLPNEVSQELNNAGQFTVSLWFRRVDDPARLIPALPGYVDNGMNRVIISQKSSSLTSGWQVQSTFFVLTWTIYSSKGTIQLTSQIPSLEKYIWHHLTIVADATSFRLFLDGDLKDTATGSKQDIILPSSANMFLSAFADKSYRWYGHFDDVVLQTKALSSSEVYSMYQSSLAPVSTTAPRTIDDKTPNNGGGGAGGDDDDDGMEFGIIVAVSVSAALFVCLVTLMCLKSCKSDSLQTVTSHAAKPNSQPSSYKHKAANKHANSPRPSGSNPLTSFFKQAAKNFLQDQVEGALGHELNFCGEQSRTSEGMQHSQC